MQEFDSKPPKVHQHLVNDIRQKFGPSTDLNTSSAQIDHLMRARRRNEDKITNFLLDHVNREISFD